MEPASQRLTDLRNGLLRLHKTLLESEQASYERDVQRIATRSELLGLVLNEVNKEMSDSYYYYGSYRKYYRAEQEA